MIYLQNSPIVNAATDISIEDHGKINCIIKEVRNFFVSSICDQFDMIQAIYFNFRKIQRFGLALKIKHPV